MSQIVSCSLFPIHSTYLVYLLLVLDAANRPSRVATKVQVRVPLWVGARCRRFASSRSWILLPSLTLLEKPDRGHSCLRRGSLATMAAFLARTVCSSQSFNHVASGAFLPGGLPAIFAATGSTLQLLVASEAHQEGEGQLEVACEQSVFAAVRAVAAIPHAAYDDAAASSGQQVRPLVGSTSADCTVYGATTAALWAPNGAPSTGVTAVCRQLCRCHCCCCCLSAGLSGPAHRLWLPVHPAI